MITTNAEYDESADIGEGFHGIAGKPADPKSKIETHQLIANAQQREAAIQYVCDIIPNAESAAACFNPHHFIEAQKGSEKVEIAICLSCSQIYCRGTKLKGASQYVGNPDWKGAAKVFGIDIKPSL